MQTDAGDVFGSALLRLARHAIADEFGIAHPPDPGSAEVPALAEPGATFVTLTSDGRLRGCIGSLMASRPVAEDVRANAFAAAFRDSRFPPLVPQEFELVKVEVSLLSPALPLTFDSEEDAIRQLRPGVDGLVFECGGHRSTFLPQVWESLPDAREFLGHLKAKSGLSAMFWSDQVRLSRYAVRKWRE